MEAEQSPHDVEELLVLVDLAGASADWGAQMSGHFVDAPGGSHFGPKFTAYHLARVRYFATRRPLNHNDFGGCVGCTHSAKPAGSGYDWEIRDDCAYHLAAALQPWNHRNPWACSSYYDGCNCEGGPFYDWPPPVAAVDKSSSGD